MDFDFIRQGTHYNVRTAVGKGPADVQVTAHELVRCPLFGGCEFPVTCETPGTCIVSASSAARVPAAREVAA